MAKQNRIPVIPPMTAADEFGTIKEVLLLSLLLTVFDRDAKVIGESKLKTKQPYIDLLQRAMDAVTKDLAKLRNRLREKGIKITDERRDGEGVGCIYWCRGYKASFDMLWHLAKAETEVRMRKYLGEDIRKYVRQDLPEHLQPEWLLAPVRLRYRKAPGTPLRSDRDGSSADDARVTSIGPGNARTVERKRARRSRRAQRTTRGKTNLRCASEV